MKRRFLAVVALIALAACGEAPTEPMALASAAAASFTHDAQHQVYTSGSNVTTWDAILPATADPNWTTTVCGAVPGVGPNANWVNPHPAYVLTGHPWASLYFSAPWINAWNDLASIGPGGHNWTRYQTNVSGNGSFVVKLLADNCSWVYLDGFLVGRQPAGHNSTNTQYGLTLNGAHTLEFIIFDGGGAAGGKFILETTTTPPPPLNPDLDGDGCLNEVDAFPLDPTRCATDNTPPSIIPNVSGTLGVDGWYTSDIAVSWTVADAESAITSPECTASTVTSNTNGVTFTCSATSEGGSASQSVTVKRDASTPTVTP
ncbi:MAG: hypothetical protein ACR2GJ_08715, partial [Gemmatimonadaceae bacterium]